MRLLLTNDDGIDAPGLAALAVVAARFGETVWLAPAHHHSGCGHRVTTDQPIHLIPKDPSRWALEGTPADCVRVALAHVTPDVDWVLSGLNHGGNLGADVYISGTVAAVREAALHGKPGIAFSQYRKRNLEIDWARADRCMDRVLRELLTIPWAPGTYWNVNLPHLVPGEPEPEIVMCPLEKGPLPLGFRVDGHAYHYEANYHQRQRGPGSDVDVCFSGQIAVTQLHL
jgi:5'-nucleotidase